MKQRFLLNLVRNIFFILRYILLILIISLSFSCLNKNNTQSNSAQSISVEQNVPLSQFELDLEFILNNYDPYLYILIDKEQALPQDYEPEDLVKLTGINTAYRINRNDMYLRNSAEKALEEMAQAARSDGLTLLVSSAYRSFAYQEQVYNRYVRQYGQQEADTFSARPGHSQHQLGLAIDFGSITDAFAETPEGKWLLANASRFGWSLSYPQGYEEITGYKWESWHYRYVGKELAAFIDTYFNSIQQHAFEFIHKINK